MFLYCKANSPIRGRAGQELAVWVPLKSYNGVHLCRKSLFPFLSETLFKKNLA